MGTLVDVDVGPRTMHCSFVADNPADGGAGPSMKKREQNLVAHSVGVFHLSVGNSHTTETVNDPEGDSLGVLVPLGGRHVASRDNNHAGKITF